MSGNEYSSFVAEYEELGLKVAERHGFAVPVQPGILLDPQRRSYRARNRSARAVAATSDLRQWLADDDPRVREIARAGIRRVLYIAYTADEGEPRAVQHRLFSLPELLVRRVLRPRVEPDRAEPWWARTPGAAGVRRAALAGALATAVGAAVALATGHLLVSVPLLCLAVGLDIFEGSFARVAGVRDPHLRWLSCVCSHAVDLAMIGGIAIAQTSRHRFDLATAVLVAMVISIFSTCVRVSALQAGYRFWRSPYERIARWAAIACYIGAGIVGESARGVAVLAVLLSVFSVGELLRVLRSVERRPASHSGVILFNDEAVLDTWPLEDADEPWLPATVSSTAARRARALAPVGHVHDHPDNRRFKPGRCDRAAQAPENPPQST